jgi:exonuclease III
MTSENVLFWNVRGLHSFTHWNVVHELVAVERLSLVGLQETKLDVILDFDVIQILGPGFDYAYLLAVNTHGGILLAWRSSVWVISNPPTKMYSLSASVRLALDRSDWWLTIIYGPSQEADKPSFITKLRQIKTGSWLLAGDFNLI